MGQKSLRANKPVLSGRPSETAAVAYAFETGEVWTIDAMVLINDPKALPLQHVLYQTALGLKNLAAYLGDLGIDGPYQWIAGLSGVKGLLVYQWINPNSRTLPEIRGKFMDHVISSSGTFDPSEDPRKALRPFTELVWKKAGLSAPDLL